MVQPSLLLPTRNLLTGTVVNWSDEELQIEGRMEAKEGLTLAWKDISIYRSRRLQRGIWRSSTYEQVKILDRVSGIATQGNLIAIMGASGSGKTSLLAAISRRDRSGISGSLLLNGRPACDVLTRISGFVPQHDLTIDDLRVGEHMTFMARMMMDRRACSGARARRVQQLLVELNVAGAVNTKLSALSGGERRRICLAVQLLNDPPILFCDEPTTGLDSWAASAVVSRLRRLSAAGKMVICSIHQPASGVFEMFDQVIFLAGGKVALQGSIEQAADFFSGLGYKCPLGFNQAEYYLSLLCVEIGNEMKSNARIRRICDEYRRSDLAAEIDRKVACQGVGSSKSGFDMMSVFDTGGQSESELFEQFLTLKKVDYFVQFCWLMWRNVVALRRSYFIWLIEMLILLVTGLVIAAPYHDATRNLDQRDIQNVEGIMYLTVTENIFTFIYCVFMAFPKELPAFLRESADELYAPTPYYLSKMLFWVPRSLIFPALYATIVFIVVGLQGGFQFCFWFAFICVLSASAANAYGSFLSATFESIEDAALVSVPIELVSLLFSGIFLNLESLSPEVAWLKYLSLFYYSTEAVSVLFWQDVKHINCADVPGMPCIRTGSEVLSQYGYKEKNFWIDVAGLCILYCAFNVIAYLMVRRRRRKAAVY